ncbi:hypothetical protein ACTHQY_09105 [Rhodococcoides corynebacterioides]|uniref:hypothetical protein n=1 Tax=Rhodococcoides corynebacterioides TaxID=53972 RepID=UPI003F811D82
MNDVRTLAALIAERKGDRSYDRLSSDCGGTPSAARLQQLTTAPLKNFPDPPSIKGMSAGLGTTVTDIVLACARSLGLEVYDGTDPSALLLSGAAELPSSSRNLLIDLAGEFLRLTTTTGLGPDEDSRTQGTPDDATAGGGTGVRTPTTGAAGRGTRKAVDATPTEQAFSVDHQGDYDLARRKGETQREHELRTQPQDEDVPQDVDRLSTRGSE